jgi:hypothetical protein
VRAEQPPDVLQRRHRIAELLPQGHDQQVADRVAVQIAVALETVLDHLGPGPPPLVVAAQRGQRLAQVARGQHPQLGTEPPAGAAVVGDGDHRRQLAGEPAQRRQGGGQSLPAAQRGDPRGLATAAGLPTTQDV